MFKKKYYNFLFFFILTTLFGPSNLHRVEVDGSVDLGAVSGNPSVVLDPCLGRRNLEAPDLDLRVAQSAVRDARIAKPVDNAAQTRVHSDQPLTGNTTRLICTIISCPSAMHGKFGLIY